MLTFFQAVLVTKEYRWDPALPQPKMHFETHSTLPHARYHLSKWIESAASDGAHVAAIFVREALPGATPTLSKVCDETRKMNTQHQFVLDSQATTVALADDYFFYEESVLSPDEQYEAYQQAQQEFALKKQGLERRKLRIDALVTRPHYRFEVEDLGSEGRANVSRWIHENVFELRNGQVIGIESGVVDWGAFYLGSCVVKGSEAGLVKHDCPEGYEPWAVWLTNDVAVTLYIGSPDTQFQLVSTRTVRCSPGEHNNGALTTTRYDKIGRGETLNHRIFAQEAAFKLQ